MVSSLSKASMPSSFGGEKKETEYNVSLIFNSTKQNEHLAFFSQGALMLSKEAELNANTIVQVRSLPIQEYFIHSVFS